MLEQTITQLRQLKLTGMADALPGQIEQPGTYEGLSFEQRIQLLAAHAQAIDYLHPRGLPQSVMASLLQCDWLNKAQNILITGPCGSGKTFIACALGHTACMKGYSVKYYRLSRLLMMLTQSKADGTYLKTLQSLAKTELLNIDDWGLEPLKAVQRNDLMELMDDRHGNASTIMLSQLPTEQWHQSIGDNTIADAILT